MPVNVEQIGKYLGKTVEDAMGRPLGKLVGLTADIRDEVTAVQVAHSDGGVAQHPIDFIKMADDRLILLQAWRVEAEGVKHEHDIIKRRKQALDLLLKDGDIDQTEYNRLRTGYEDISKDIQAKRDKLLDDLSEIEIRLAQQISDLQGALTNNKMLYSSTEIDEETYHSVTESIRSGLEIARKERKDVGNTREYLNDMDSSNVPDSVPTPPQPDVKTGSSDIVVIKMNELSQA